MDITKFSLATSWDDKLVGNLAVLNQQHQQRQVQEVFGSFKSSIVGCGRPSYRLPEVSVEHAKRHIQLLHDKGILFNYALNAPDFMGKERDGAWLEQVKDLLELLEGIGVDILTISNPVLVELAKKHFSDFRITLSLIAGVDSVESAKRFEDMGVDVITLNPHTVNRDFTIIEQICLSVSCGIELYANIPCLNQCPKAHAHYVYLGHMSQNDGVEEIEHKPVDPYLAWCSCVYLTRPVELVKSPFIRPEDVRIYQELGVRLFKLSDRGESTEWLTSTLSAYMSGQYGGDLFNLIFRAGKKFRVGISEIHPEVAEEAIRIAIDNAVLSEMGFIEQIRNLPQDQLPAFYDEVTRRAVKVEETSLATSLRGFLKDNRV